MRPLMMAGGRESISASAAGRVCANFYAAHNAISTILLHFNFYTEQQSWDALRK